MSRSTGWFRKIAEAVSAGRQDYRAFVSTLKLSASEGALWAM